MLIYLDFIDKSWYIGKCFYLVNSTENQSLLRERDKDDFVHKFENEGGKKEETASV